MSLGKFSYFLSSLLSISCFEALEVSKHTEKRMKGKDVLLNVSSFCHSLPCPS